MTRVCRSPLTLVLGSTTSTRAINATPLLGTWYTPNALITRPVVSGTGVAVTVSFVAAYSPAIVNCFDRYESIPRKRLRGPRLVGLRTPAYPVIRRTPARLL